MNNFYESRKIDVSKTELDQTYEEVAGVAIVTREF